VYVNSTSYFALSTAFDLLVNVARVLAYLKREMEPGPPG